MAEATKSFMIAESTKGGFDEQFRCVCARRKMNSIERMDGGEEGEDDNGKKKERWEKR